MNKLEQFAKQVLSIMSTTHGAKSEQQVSYDRLFDIAAAAEDLGLGEINADGNALTRWLNPINDEPKQSN